MRRREEEGCLGKKRRKKRRKKEEVEMITHNEDESKGNKLWKRTRENCKSERKERETKTDGWTDEEEGEESAMGELGGRDIGERAIIPTNSLRASLTEAKRIGPLPESDQPK